MRILKFALYISLLFCQSVFAQTTITISEAIPNNTEPIERIARDAVIMKPGFSYKALSTTPLRAALDKTLTGDQLYNGSSPTQVGTPDPNTPPRTLDKSLALGSVGGAVNVSPSGAASYNVPISVPAGINGMQPSVALAYSSQGADGIMGIGWNLSCASAISRAANNRYFDGLQTNVLLTTDDPLTLDGMRLVCSDAGKKGLAGTNFKTELDNNSLITQAGGGFIVKTPDGKTMEYGVDATARFQVTYNGAITTVSWLLNKVTDANGISINYKYKTNASTGEVYITSIEYANKKVQFLYTNRTDTWTGKLLSATISRTVLLEKVEVFSNNSLLNTYALKYSQENAISQLTEVTQTNRDGESVNATLFKWNKPQYTTPTIKTPKSFISDVNDQYFQGDFNGDGFEDVVVYRKKSSWDHSTVLTSTKYCNTNDYEYSFFFLKGTANGLVNNSQKTTLPRSVLYNDFRRNVEQTLLKFNSSINPEEMDFLNQYLNDISLVTSGDFDGDGVQEICVGVRHIYIPQTQESIDNFQKFEDGIFPVTFNFGFLGVHYYFFKADQTKLIPINEKYASSGRLLENIYVTQELDNPTVDFNQDGKTDFRYKSTATTADFYSVNSGYTAFNLIGTTNKDVFTQHDIVSPFDFNGDGIKDYISFKDNKIYNQDKNGLFSLINMANYQKDWTSRIDYSRGYKLNNSPFYSDRVYNSASGFNWQRISLDNGAFVYFNNTWSKKVLRWGQNNAGTDIGFASFPDDNVCSVTLNNRYFPIILSVTDMNNDGNCQLISSICDIQQSDWKKFSNSIANRTLPPFPRYYDVISYQIPGPAHINNLYWDVRNVTYSSPTIYDCYRYLVKSMDNGSYQNKDSYLDESVFKTITSCSFPKDVPIYKTLDVNGDGWEDVLEIASGNLRKIRVNTHLKSYNDIAVDIPLGKNVLVGDFNGDGNKEIVGFGDTEFKEIIFNNCQAGYHIAEIIDGMNNRTQITYKPLTDASVFEKEVSSKPTYPVASIITPMYVVSSLKNSTGLKDGSSNEIWNTSNYQYQNLLSHMQSKGLLGFEKVLTTKVNTRQLQKQLFELDSKFYTLSLKKVEQFQVIVVETQTTNEAGETLIANSISLNLANSTEYINEIKDLGNKRFRKNIIQSIQNDIPNGVKTTSTNVYDPTTGNLTKNTTVYGAGADVTEITDIVYNPIGSSGNFFKPRTTTKTTTYNGQSPFVQKKAFSYDGNGNLLTQVDFDNLAAAEKVTTTYSNYDKGLPRKIEKTAVGVQTAKAEYQYNALGQVVWSKDALNLESTNTYDPTTDLLLSSKDPLGNETKYYYNAWGQLTQKVNPLGTSGTSSLVWAGTDTDAPANALLKKTSSATGQSELVTYFDAKGRELRSVAVDAFGSKVYSEKEYDNLGRVVAVTEPHFASETKRYSTTVYDEFGRVKTVTTPLDATTVTYDGLTTTSTVNGKSESKTTNAKGDVLSASDKMGNVVTYTYHSSGQPLTITAVGATTSMEYNNKGLQTKLTDPDAGPTTYEYDNFGRLSKQTDAKGNMFSMTYDVAGRQLTKSGMGYSLSNSYNSTTGLLETTTYTQPDASTHTRVLTYDKYGRTLTQKEVISGLGTYTNALSYDALGRVDTKTYPSGFALKYQYSSYNGEQTHIKKAADNSLIWQLTQQNSKGQALKYSWGNGIVNTNTYSANGYLTRQQTGSNIQDLEYGYVEPEGNMLRRSENIYEQGEYFGYDDLNRLTAIYPDLGYTMDMEYAPNGNITSKSDVGNYEYSATRPHAVSKITNNLANIPLCTQDIVYNEFGKVATISEAANSLSIRYGMDNQRIESKWFTNGSLVKSRIYFGDYEIHKVGATSKEIHYIFAPTGLVAVDVRQNGADQLLYACTDHLGSLTALVNQAGEAVEKYSYDAWGRPRKFDIWSVYTIDVGILDQAYEYTGHETLAEFGLINMNGRVYDPVLGRMLSPDNYVSNPLLAADYNRYSYCRNNPLAYTDPSGNNPIGWLLAAAIIIGKNYHDGYNANNHQANPFKWDWSKASYSFGLGGTAGGDYHANLGVGWGGNATVIGFSNQGFGFGYHSFNGNSFFGYPGEGYDIAAEIAYPSIAVTDWGIYQLDRHAAFMKSGMAESIHPEFDLILGARLVWNAAFSSPTYSSVLESEFVLPSGYPRTLLQFNASQEVYVGAAMGQKSIVLGEGMGAVKTTAKTLQSQGLNAKWYQAWSKNFPTNRLMTAAEMDAALARNARWLNTKINQGYKIYDIGIDVTRTTRSPFYQLEQSILQQRGYPTTIIPR